MTFETVESTPLLEAVNTDLRMLPNLDIIYVPKGSVSPQPYIGELRRLYRDKSDNKIKANIVITSLGLSGMNHGMTEKQFGKNKVDCWYFRNPSEETRIVMHNLGYEMTEDEMRPDWSDLKILKDKATIEEEKEIADKAKQIMEAANDPDPTAGSGNTATENHSHAGKQSHRLQTAKAS